MLTQQKIQEIRLSGSDLSDSQKQEISDNLESAQLAAYEMMRPTMTDDQLVIWDRIWQDINEILWANLPESVI